MKTLEFKDIEVTQCPDKPDTFVIIGLHSDEPVAVYRHQLVLLVKEATRALYAEAEEFERSVKEFEATLAQFSGSKVAPLVHPDIHC